jgi:iron(III) transport system ATP-binding protein
VVATADPRTLYDEPSDLNAATFIGEANILEAEVRGGLAACVLGLVEAAQPAGGPPVEGPAQLLLRPEQLVLHLGPTAGAVAAKVIDDQYHGHDAVVLVAVESSGDATLSARVPGDLSLAQGQPVWVAVRGTGRVWPLEDREVS